MSDSPAPHDGLDLVTRLAALVQSGLAYTNNPFDIERYEEMQQICARLMAGNGPIEMAVLHAAFSQQVGYATPKMDVRAGCFVDGRIVLVRERADGDRWTLPGGWADVGYSPADCVLKEVREECGLTASVTKLAAVCDRRRTHHNMRSAFHIWKMLFVCEVTGGTFVENTETSGMETFAREEIPENLSLSRTSPEHIALLFDHHDHPEYPTRCD